MALPAAPLGYEGVILEFISNKFASSLISLSNRVQVALRFFGDCDVLKQDPVKEHKCRDSLFGGAMHEYRAMIESIQDTAKALCRPTGGVEFVTNGTEP